jgi:sucrose-6-phosphate hydrolase SacC (GH32 family)
LNGGQKVMTAQFFNTNPYNQLKIENKGTEKAVFKGLKITPIHSIWGQD